jgi:MFS family permease
MFDLGPNLLVARFMLGFAVGAKSSTTPVYAAESAPKTIRGALTMMWQMWTAFGKTPMYELHVRHTLTLYIDI